MKEDLLSKIPNKVDSNILAVYTDCESDVNGAYTFMTGARVSSANVVPPGMVANRVPAGRYAVFTSEKGYVGKVVPETWSRIWAAIKSAAGGTRAKPFMGILSRLSEAAKPLISIEEFW